MAGINSREKIAYFYNKSSFWNLAKLRNYFSKIHTYVHYSDIASFGINLWCSIFNRKLCTRSCSMQSVRARDPLIYHEFLKLTNLTLHVNRWIRVYWLYSRGSVVFFGWMCFAPRFSNNSVSFSVLNANCKVVELFRWVTCYFFPPNWLGGSSHIVLFYFWHTYKNFSHKLQLNRVATFSKCRGIYGALIWFYLLELVNRIAMMKFWFSFFFLKNFIILFVIPIIGN